MSPPLFHVKNFYYICYKFTIKLNQKEVRSEDDNNEIRLSEDGVYQKIDDRHSIRRGILHRQKEFKEKVKFSKIEYTFLQFHHAIWKWAMANTKLTNGRLSYLLYIHPLVTFTGEEAIEAQRELGAVDGHALSDLKKRGWIIEWSKEGRTPLYCLSSKANLLIARMHRMYMLEEQIPTSRRRNVIARRVSKESKQLMGIFNKFNKIVKERGYEKRSSKEG